MTTTTMPLFSLDTLQFSKRLQNAGLKQEIAEELAEAIKDVQTQSNEGLSTKGDILLLKKDIEVVRHEIESLKHELVLKMFFMIVAAVAIITWLDKVIK